MKKESKKVIRVAELFAGVGGFRLGLDQASSKKAGFETIWSNQWEPGSTKQHASEVYVARFGDKGHSNVDISKVPVSDIPDHDLLVGGFPCQDYSVARVLSQAKGLAGKKGVLWWDIHRILKEKGKKAPSYLMLENVDRLLKSPATQRGRDFAVMLASLSDLGYAAEWRVINAAEYGMPQRRRRTYIMGYKKGTPEYNQVKKAAKEPLIYALRDGVMASAFPVLEEETISFIPFELEGDLAEITESFNKGKSISPFHNCGFMIGRKVWAWKTKPKYKGPFITLGDIIEKDEKKIPKEYFLADSSMKEWVRQKGGKKETRVTKGGFEYNYSEGPMSFPDSLDKASRTIVTGEGGSTPSRFKHVIKTKSGKFRRLTPVELEKLNMFPPNHTAGPGDSRRAFFMGNALVVGVIEKLGRVLLALNNRA